MILSILLFDTKLFRLIKNSFSEDNSFSSDGSFSTVLSSTDEVLGPCDK